MRTARGLMVLLALSAVAAAAPAPARGSAVTEQVDPAHTGVATETLPAPLRERWRKTFDPGVPIDHEVRWPLIADGRAFVTYQDRDGGPGEVHPLDPVTGASLWTRQVDGFLRGAGYGAGRVLVSTSTTLHAFDAVTGAPVWSRSAWPGRDGSNLQGGAVVADGRRLRRRRRLWRRADTRST